MVLVKFNINKPQLWFEKWNVSYRLDGLSTKTNKDLVKAVFTICLCDRNEILNEVEKFFYSFVLREIKI